MRADREEALGGKEGWAVAVAAALVPVDVENEERGERTFWGRTASAAVLTAE